jgi:hypothetical protein
MNRKYIQYDERRIESIGKDELIKSMQVYYDSGMNDYHKVGYFDYVPSGLMDIFPLCQQETRETISEYFHNYKPKHEKYEYEHKYKLAIYNDEDSLIFPKYSIVDWSVKPKYRLWKRALSIFISEAAHRFIIFTNYKEKKALLGCGGYGHLVFCSESNEGITHNVHK